MDKVFLTVLILWVLGTVVMLLAGAGWATLFCSPIWGVMLLSEAAEYFNSRRYIR